MAVPRIRFRRSFRRSFHLLFICTCFLGIFVVYKEYDSTSFVETVGNGKRSKPLEIHTTPAPTTIVTTEAVETTTSAPPTTNLSSLLDDMKNYVKDIPKGSGLNLFNYVTEVLLQPWHHNPKRAKHFRFSLENKTNLSTSQHMMITQKNTPLGSFIPSIFSRKSMVNATKEVFDKFQKESSIHHYKTCSVVGSSGILSGSQCGKAIDNADFVIRFNLAPTIGFEVDVGNKTNLTTMNPSISIRNFGNLKKKEQKTNFIRLLSVQKGLVWTPTYAFKGYLKSVLKAIAMGQNMTNFEFIHEGTRHFLALETFWRQYGFKKLSSTGFYFVTSSLAICDKVNLYGFWPFGKLASGEDVRYHYFDESKAKLHDMSLEFKWIFTMHHFGLLKLHIGNCTNGIN